MRRIFTPILFLSLIAFALSCDDSFLEENKKQIDGFELDEKVMIPFNPGANQINIQTDQFNDNAAFSIVQYPKSMKLNSLKGTINNQTLSIPYFFEGIGATLFGTPVDVGSIIVKIDDFGYLKINISTVNYGHPVIRIDQNEIDYKDYLVTSRLEIMNSSAGLLLYHFLKYPDWIFIEESQKKGSLYSYESKNVTIRCDRFNLDPGSYEGEIEVLNEVTNEITKIKVKMVVSAYMNPKSLIGIDGIVTDAEFDKNTNTIYIATQNPNKLISYHLDTDTKKELTLDRNINCLTFSDDNKYLFVGQSAKLTHVNATTFAVVNSYDLSFNVKDIVYDGTEFCYMTYKGSGFEYLHYISRLSLKTNQVTIYEISEVYENTNLFKMKNTNYFLATRESISPSGIILFDYSTNEPVVARYWHMDEGARFWFSEDHKYMYTQHGKIYTTPTFQSANDLGSLGIFIPEEYDITYPSYSYDWMDHCAQSKSVWGAYNKGNPTVSKNIVTEFDDMTYTRKRVLALNDYHTTINGVTDFYPTIAHYVFSNKNGNTIALVKNVALYNSTAWNLEIIDVIK